MLQKEREVAVPAGFQTAREAGIDAKAAVLCKLGLGMRSP